MRVYTSNFENLDNILEAGMIGVAICLKCPHDYKGPWMPELAPTKKILYKYHANHDEEAYVEKYLEILSKLDAVTIYDELQTYGREKDVVMLCHEPRGKFCHRHLVAQWLANQIGIVIEEWIEGN